MISWLLEKFGYVKREKFLDKRMEVLRYLNLLAFKPSSKTCLKSKASKAEVLQ